MFKRAYKYRFYPTQDQADQLARTFGCVRFVYNWALDLKQQTWRENQESLSCGQLSARLTILKKQPAYAWLNEVSCVPLQQSLGTSIEPTATSLPNAPASPPSNASITAKPPSLPARPLPTGRAPSPWLRSAPSTCAGRGHLGGLPPP